MSDPYVGEIRLVGFNFAPVGWAFCNGETLAISQYEVLFQLIGTTYGGDGQQTFQLPDLQGRSPVHQGQGAGLSSRVLGEKAGSEQVTLSPQQMPQHSHPAKCDTTGGNQLSPANGFWSVDPSGQFGNYAASTDSVMNPGAVGMAGGSQPHENLQPYLGMNYIISLFGIFPSQS